MDGISIWKSISENSESPRNLMLHNIDDTRHIASVRVGDWKLMKGKLNPGLTFLNSVSGLKYQPFPIDSTMFCFCLCLVPRPGQSTWLEELMNG